MAPALALLAASVALSQGPVVTSLTIFAGTEVGLWRSRDWGASWERVKGRGQEVEGAVNAILPRGPAVYAGGQGGLYVSEDFGESWTRSYSDAPVLAICPSRYPQVDLTVFLGVAAGLLKSNDGGRSFGATSLKGIPVHRIEWPGPALVVATGRGVLVSMDEGASFAAAGTGFPPGESLALALSSFYPLDPVLFAGAGAEGVFRSSDGGKAWTSTGLQGRKVRDLAWLGPWLYAVTDGGLYRSGDTGHSWSPFAEGLAGRTPRRILFPLAPDSGAEVFLAADQGVYKSSDGGQSWVSSGLQGVRVLATFPPPERFPRKRK